jgi:hypothetical protein
LGLSLEARSLLLIHWRKQIEPKNLKAGGAKRIAGILSSGLLIAAEQIASDLVERPIEGWRKAELEIAGADSPKAAAPC